MSLSTAEGSLQGLQQASSQGLKHKEGGAEPVLSISNWTSLRGTGNMSDNCLKLCLVQYNYSV